MKNFFKAALDAYATSLTLIAVEARHRISRIEATAADEFQNKLMAVAPKPEERQQIRDAAIALGNLGIMGYKDVHLMAYDYHLLKMFGITTEDVRLLGKLKQVVRGAQR
jgi:hypothetical protein